MSEKSKAFDTLEYRFGAIKIGLLALEKRTLWAESDSKACIYVNGKLDTELTTTAFTNSAFEAAVIHSRILLEFLGLKLNNKRALVQDIRNNSRPDDLLIENEMFGELNAIHPEDAVKSYSAPPDEAERALAYVIHLANKGLAHSTINFKPDDEDFKLLDIAFRGVVKLMENRFYLPLGLEIPGSLVSEVRTKGKNGAWSCMAHRG